MALYKALALAGGTVTAVGGGILVSRSSLDQSTSNPKTTIKDRLQKAGYSLDFDESKWSTIHEEYKKPSTSINVKFSSKTMDVEALKKECSSYLKEEENSPKYEIAKRWCVEPRKISEFLTISKLHALKTNGNEEQDGDKSKWIKLEEEYSKNTREKIEGWQFSKVKDENTWKELQAKCKALLDLNPWNDNYEKAMNETKLWCVEEAVPK